MSHRHLAATASLVLLLALSGCATESSGTAATAEPATTATADTTSTPSPTPTSTATMDPANYTCETILPAGTLAVFADKEDEGFTLQDDFIERSRNYGSDLVYFVDFGGILCQWGYPSGTEPVNYGFSPITDAQAAERMTQLTDGGFVTQKDDRGTLVVNADTVSFPDTYLFVDGYWFYGSDIDMLELIVDNLPDL